MNTFDLNVIRNRVLKMNDEEKNIFLDKFRKSKGWTIEDEQRLIEIINNSDLGRKLKDAVEYLQGLLNESKHK
jgi:hypothetical protein